VFLECRPAHGRPPFRDAADQVKPNHTALPMEPGERRLQKALT